MKILAVGDNCIDHYVKQGRKYVGGCSVNFSVYMRQLGAQSAYLGAVGNDENGALIVDGLQRVGVDVSRIHVLEGDTAVTEVELAGNDRRFLSYRKGVLEKLRLKPEDYAYIREFDLIHTSVYGNVDAELAMLSENAVLCYDFGDKLDYEGLEKALGAVHYAFFSYKEDDGYIRRYLKKAYACGPRCTVATLGENGSLAYDGKDFFRWGIRRVRTVDTIGAGDSFIAGFMYARMEGRAIPECLAGGAAKAEETVQHFGAF